MLVGSCVVVWVVEEFCCDVGTGIVVMFCGSFGAGLTDCAKESEVLETKFPSPEYTALRSWEPSERDDTSKAACPPEIMLVPMTDWPS